MRTREQRLAQMREYSNARYRRLQSKRVQQIKRKNHTSRIRQMIVDEKLRRGKCEWPEGCPLPEVSFETLHGFDFDHRNPHEKSFMLSKVRGQHVDRVSAEMDKCDLLCAYHHRLKTQRQREHRLSKVKELQITLFDN